MASTTFSGPVTSTAGFVGAVTGNVTGNVTGAINPTEVMAAGAGVTGGTGTIYETSVVQSGGLITTQIYIDLTGLDSSGTAGDIIGTSTDPAYIGQVTAAVNGTVLAVKMECLEAPGTGEPNIDLYSADEATGAFDGAITSLTETQILDSGDLSAGTAVYGDTIAADQYLYLVAQDTDDATYTAGKLLITIIGQA